MQRGTFLSKDLNYEYVVGTTYSELCVKDSDISGSGVFTKEHIQAGDCICPLFGILYMLDQAKISYPKYSYQISDTAAIETANEPGYINHSCSPNIYLGNNWSFYAIHDIPADSEIVIDYATVDFFDYSFECDCGSENCRNIFSGILSQDIDFQKKCGHLFSPYLKEKFLK
jgi:SET domain-containing protein